MSDRADQLLRELIADLEMRAKIGVWQGNDELDHSIQASAGIYSRCSAYLSENMAEHNDAGAEMREPQPDECSSVTVPGEPGVSESRAAHQPAVRKLPAGAVKDDPADPVDEGPSPAGLWAHFTEYPEEGCLYLGPCEVEDNAAPRVEGEAE